MGVDLGAVHVPIVPTMRGFRKFAKQEGESAGNDAAKGFGARFTSGATKAGTESGRGFARAFSGGANAGGAFKSFERDVARATAAVSAARRQEVDAAGRVRVAEARLEEARARGGAASSRAVAAEEALSRARRAHETAQQRTTAATTALSGAQTRLQSVLTATTSAAQTQAGPRGFGAIATAARSAGPAIGSALSAGARVASDALRSIGAAAHSAIAVGVTTAVGIAATALSGGFNRLNSMETASAKMKGLGLDAAQVAAAMKVAEAAAAGTSFGMDEMAAAAGQALTSGVGQGDDLATYLNTVRGAAIASGAPLSEIAQILGKVRASGGGPITTEITQLGDRGIPVWQKLSEAIGVSIADVKKLSSEGKISAEQLEEAVRAATGGMAEAMAGTTETSAKNVTAALRRFGVALIGAKLDGDRVVGGLWPLFKGLFDTIRTGLDAATAAVGPFMAVFGGAITERILPVLTGLQEKFVAFKTSFQLPPLDGGNLIATLGPIAALVGGALLPLLSGLLTSLPLVGGLFTAISGPVGLLIGLLGALAVSGGDATAMMGSITGVITGALGQVPTIVTAITSALPGMVSGITAAVPAIIGGVVGIIPSLVTAFVSLAPVLIQAGVLLITSLVSGLASSLPLIIDGALQLVTGLLTGIITALPTLAQGASTLVLGLLDGIIASIPVLISGAITLVLGLVTGLIAAIPQLAIAAIDLVLGLVTGLLGAIPQLITGAVTLITGLVTGLIGAIPLLLDAAVQLIIGLIGGIVSAIPQLIMMAPQIILSLITGLLTALPELITMGPQLIMSLVTGLLSALPQLLAATPQMIAALITGVMEMGPEFAAMGPQLAQTFQDEILGFDWGGMLIGSGEALIQGFIDGINAMIGSVTGAVESVVAAVGEFFPHSPAKRGPLSGTGYTSYSGRAMVDDFADGMRSRLDVVARAADSVTGASRLRAMSETADAVPARGNAAAGGIQIIVQTQPGQGSMEIAHDIAWVLEDQIGR